MAALTIQTANDAVELADYNNRPKPDSRDKPTIDDNTDSDPNNEDTVITSTISATISTTASTTEPTTVSTAVSTTAVSTTGPTAYIFSAA